MPQTIHRGIKSLVDEANAEIETVSALEAITAAQSDEVVIVDIRDPREIERDGKIPGSFSCTGGMRSALAAKTAQDMGLKPVAHMAGGFAAWRDAGGPTEKWEPKKKGQ